MLLLFQDLVQQFNEPDGYLLSARFGWLNSSRVVTDALAVKNLMQRTRHYLRTLNSYFLCCNFLHRSDGGLQLAGV